MKYYKKSYRSNLNVRYYFLRLMTPMPSAGSHYASSNLSYDQSSQLYSINSSINNNNSVNNTNAVTLNETTTKLPNINTAKIINHFNVINQ